MGGSKAEDSPPHLASPPHREWCIKGPRARWAGLRTPLHPSPNLWRLPGQLRELDYRI